MNTLDIAIYASALITGYLIGDMTGYRRARDVFKPIIDRLISTLERWVDEDEAGD